MTIRKTGTERRAKIAEPSQVSRAEPRAASRAHLPARLFRKFMFLLEKSFARTAMVDARRYDASLGHDQGAY